MSFLGSLTSLLDDSDGFKNKIVGAIDNVEATLNSALDKAEGGVKQAEAVTQHAAGAGDRLTTVVDTVSDTNEKVISTVNKSATNASASEGGV
jgi:exonuclease VII small subunit